MIYNLLLEAWCISYGLVHSEKFWALMVASVFVFIAVDLWRGAIAND